MTAKKMFERLGYRRYVYKSAIMYRRINDYMDYTITFYTGNYSPKTYDFSFLEWSDINGEGYGDWRQGDYSIGINLHKAINKQIEELGWNN